MVRMVQAAMAVTQAATTTEAAIVAAKTMVAVTEVAMGGEAKAMAVWEEGVVPVEHVRVLQEENTSVEATVADEREEGTLAALTAVTIVVMQVAV